VNEIHKPIARQGGYFVSGKFDQFKRGLPYSSLLQAFRQLIRQLLTEGEASLAVWKSRLQEALGPIAQVVIDVIPEVALIVGAQPPAPPLGPEESQNRFRQVFQSFIRVFAQPRHPLVVFLDDLQWADAASLNLIQYLASEQGGGNLLLIGAYRDNEVDGAHPLARALERLQKGGTPVTAIPLSPLSREDLDRWLADALRCDEATARPLGALIHAKTNGNPFFTLELVRSLHQDGLLAFDRGLWRWDLKQIEAVQITDNVIDLLVGKVQKLPEETQAVLKLASCIGSRFDSRTLATVYERSPRETTRALWEAVREGLILPLDPSYALELEDAAVSFEFLHDRVQQAAHSLIPEAEKRQLHLTIGRLLRGGRPGEQLGDQLFEICNHLDAGAELVKDEAERRALAELNLLAGRKAKASTAYDAALTYLSAGAELLGEAGWQAQHALAFALHLELAQCEYLITRFAEADRRFERLLSEARTDGDRVSVHTTRVLQFLHTRQYERAVETGVVALRLLGIRLSANPGPRELISEMVQVRWKLRGQKIAALLDRPQRAPADIQAAMSLLSSLWFPAYLLKREGLVGLLVLKMVHLSLIHGNTDASSFAFACYGVFNSSVLGKPAQGAEYGKLALALARKFDVPAVTCRTLFVHASFLEVFTSHLRKTLELLEESLQLSVTSGNLIQAGYTMCLMTYWKSILDTPLQELAAESKKFLDFGRRVDVQKLVQCMLVQQRWVTELRDGEPAALRDKAHSLKPAPEVTDEMEIAQNQLMQLQLGYLFERYQEAFQLSVQVEASKDMLEPSSSFVPFHAFYQAMCALALPRHELARGRLRKSLKTLRRWAENSPQNARHKLLLVQAGMAQAEGRAQRAAELYDEAIQAARRSEYQQDTAIACERAALFHLGRGSAGLARSYLQEARFAYLTWGAMAKVRDLEAAHPQLLAQAPAAEAKSAPAVASTSVELDLETVVRASQVLSGEIVLARLLERIMQIVLENAGAQRGFLIMKEGAQLAIEAEGTVDRQAAVAPALPVEQSQGLSPAMVSYVARTRESIVLRDAAKEGLFTSDPYVVRAQPRSVLCTPLIHQGQLVGVLYLENNLAADTFTPGRLEVQQILSTQIAISITNARHYEQLERKVSERTEDLNRRNTELKDALDHLRRTQRMLLQAEKMSSLGQLTAGIAHEIKNPINFINNFAQLSADLAQELRQELEAKRDRPAGEVLSGLSEELEDLRANTISIVEHGKRADSIINGMLLHSRAARGEPVETELNPLIDQHVMLAYQGMRGSIPGFEVQVEKELDPALPRVEVSAQDIARVVLNLTNNALHAAHGRKRPRDAAARVRVATRALADKVEIRVWDNGDGIPAAVQDKIFEPFFTTKPAGQGTGLGLSLSHDIVVQGHGGSLRFETREGGPTEFIIELPRRQASPSSDSSR
jgi:histidine kinase